MKTGSTWWLGLSGRSYEQMRVIVLEFLDTDVFNVSVENCDSFLDPLIESWDIDLVTFAMEIVLNRRLAPGHPKKFEFVEKEADQPSEEEPGFKRFLRDRSLSGDATEEEIEFLKRLRFNGKRPTPLYYYRELQNLRDPLHFRSLLPQTPRTKNTGPVPAGTVSRPDAQTSWRLMALRNNCSLTAGKMQYGAGQETKTGGAKNKRQSP